MSVDASKLAVAASPALLVFSATMVISFSVGTPEGLFLAPAIEHIPGRFLFIMLILLAPLSLLPRILVFAKKTTRKLQPLGELVRINKEQNTVLNKTIVWVIRPVQGIGISMIFAQRLLNLFEFSSDASLANVLLRPTLFIVNSALASILLCVVWALDDLDIRIYSSKSGEVRMAGNTIGTVLPIIFGVLGVYSLFQSSNFISALITVVEIAMVLYPPFLFLA